MRTYAAETRRETVNTEQILETAEMHFKRNSKTYYNAVAVVRKKGKSGLWFFSRFMDKNSVHPSRLTDKLQHK